VAADEDLEFSLVRGGALYRFQRAVGLIPPDGLGVGRRVAVLLAITWVPVVAFAAIDRRLFEGAAADPLLRHFGVHARCLVAIPLFLAGELAVERFLPILIRYFRVSGLVGADMAARFREVLRRTEALRDSWWVPVSLLAAVAVGISYVARDPLAVHEVTWAIDESAERPYILFAGYWYLFVSRPIFVLLLVQWLWRVVLVAILFRRITALGLDLVPTHPDNAAGLGFLENAPTTFVPVVFGMSAVFAATQGHEVLYHGVHVDNLYLPMGVYAAIVIVVFLAPLLPFSGPLRRLKRRALLEYGALVGGQGRLVDRRWIRGEDVDAPVLSAPEIGPVADAITLYDAVSQIRPAPFRKGPVIALAVAALLPMVPVLAIEVPIKALLLKVLGSLL
jgi:hypothetical protein